jgi:hypothetical protein
MRWIKRRRKFTLVAFAADTWDIGRLWAGDGDVNGGSARAYP